MGLMQRPAVRRSAALLVALGLLWAGHHSYGWAGVAAVAGGLVMWALLHLTRTLQVLQRTARRPIGHVDSAVMLNSRLRPGLPLLQVLALNRALGEPLSAPDSQPEVYRWRDPGGSEVQAEFWHGRLQRWSLHRPDPADR